MNGRHFYFRIFTLCVVFVLVTSCAHRSGHGKKQSDNRRTTLNERFEQQLRKEKPVVEHPDNQNKMEGSEIFRKYGEAVFIIVTSNGKELHQGSGFFIGSDGLAVSNYHVFNGTGKDGGVVKLAGDDNVYKIAQVYAKSEEEDFILFRIECDNQVYLPIATSRPQVGDKVFAIGSPLGLENTFSSGEVSQWRDQYLMQISAQIDHGSSGGALVNEYGEVVGITSGTFAEGSQANLNYAWSIDVVKPYLKEK